MAKFELWSPTPVRPHDFRATEKTGNRLKENRENREIGLFERGKSVLLHFFKMRPNFGLFFTHRTAFQKICRFAA